MTIQNNKSTPGRRIAATIIDYSVIFLLTFFYISVFGSSDIDGGNSVSGIATLPPVIFWFLYLVLPEYYAGGTLGHQLLDLKVVPLHRKKLSLTQVFKRRISDGLEITWCFGLIAYLLVKNTPLNQRLGDLWAKTIVMDKDQQNNSPQSQVL